MKNLLLFLLFSLTTLTTFAQTQKIETRHFGILDTVYYVEKNDTFLVEKYYKNGQVESKKWKKDSIYEYYSDGNISNKVLGIFEHNFGYRFGKFTEPSDDDSDIIYYPNGSVFRQFYWENKDMYHEESFKPNGELVKGELYLRLNSNQGVCHQFYHAVFEKGIKTDAVLADTLTKLQIDSTFSASGTLEQIKFLKIKEGKDELLKKIRFDTLGHSKIVWQLDSNRLHPDKDNSNCSFGFRNMRGDWVVTPQYDNVIRFKTTYFIISKNEKYGIIDDFGKTIVPFDYDFIGDLNGTEADIDVINEHDLNDRSGEYYYLKFRKGGKYGVMDLNGKVFVTPQYENVGKFIGDELAVKIGKKWGIADFYGRLIVPARYDAVEFTGSEEYYIGIVKFESKKSYQNYELKCLVNNKGIEVLDAKFSEIQADFENTNVFKVKVKNFAEEEFDSEPITEFEGIFDVKKGWLLDTTYSTRNDNGTTEFFNRKLKPTGDEKLKGLFGYVNPKNIVVLPFEFDDIAEIQNNSFNALRCDGISLETGILEHPIFVCRKNNKFGLFDKNTEKWLIPLKYDFISCLNIQTNILDNDFRALKNNLRFLALKDNKWRWINEQDQLLPDELVDYAAESSRFDGDIFTFQNDSAKVWDSEYFPNNKPIEEVINHLLRQMDNKTDTSKTQIFELTDLKLGSFFINRKGRIIVPPQYSIVSYEGEHAFAKDSKGKQYLFDLQGNKRLFSSDFKVCLAQIEQNAVVVEDTLKKKMGLLDANGKVVIPIVNNAVSMADSFNVLWVQPKKPLRKISDSLAFGFQSSVFSAKEIDTILEHSFIYNINEQDSGWLMMNTKGRQLAQNPFAFPFEINKYRQGIGTIRNPKDDKTHKTGIWKADGSVLLPPQYDKIYFDNVGGIYHLYQKQNDGSYLVGFCDTLGQIIVPPSLEQMGVFNGNYALVQTKEGLGIIMKNGKYKLTPAKNSFRTANFNIDSLLSFSELKNGKMGVRPNYAYYTFLREGSRNVIEKVRKNQNQFKILSNLIAEKTSVCEFIDGKYLGLNRIYTPIFKSDKGSENTLSEYRYKGVIGLNASVSSVRDVNEQVNSIGFILETQDGRIQRSCGFGGGSLSYHNFIQEPNNPIWKEVTVEYYVKDTPDNTFKMNQLIINKIKDLKDSKINCSNPEGYFAEIKDRFYVFPEGVRFYFLSMRQEDPSIFFTFEELKGLR